MSGHPKRLIAHKVWFFSEHDEEAFFEWLDKMVCIQEYHGDGEDLHITSVETTLEDNSLRELLALFYRYDIDMPQLATFQTSGNRSWFHDPNAYLAYEGVWKQQRLTLDDIRGAGKGVRGEGGRGEGGLKGVTEGGHEGGQVLPFAPSALAIKRLTRESERPISRAMALRGARFRSGPSGLRHAAIGIWSGASSCSRTGAPKPSGTGRERRCSRSWRRSCVCAIPSCRSLPRSSGSASRRAFESRGTASCWPATPSPTARGPIPRPSWPSSSCRLSSWGYAASAPSSIYHPANRSGSWSISAPSWNAVGEPLEGEAAPDMVVALAGATQILVPLAGLIERDKELKRLDSEIEKLACDHARSGDKLANIDYLERAPPEVVSREHARSAEIEAAIQHLREQRRRVESLK